MTKILVTGGKNGFIGQPVSELLRQKGYTVSAIGRDYCNFLEGQENIESMLSFEKPNAVIMCHGLVKGIVGNSANPYTMLHTNLKMNTDFIEACRKENIPRLIFIFCGCSYPNHAKNPIREEDLFTGIPSPESMFYSLGKAVSHLQVQAARQQFGLDWSSIILGNVYGPRDNFDLNESHVIPGMIRKFHEAKIRDDKSITLWGNGFPIRDFLHVDDAAEGVIQALDKHHSKNVINISSGKGVSIKETAEIIKDVVGFKGDICWDISKPNGQQVKVFDCERAEQILGFKAKTGLKEGITKTYDWFVKSRIGGFI